MTTIGHDLCRERERKMRVCMVAYTFYETDNRVKRYSESLVERGDSVDVIVLRRPGQLRFDQFSGVNVYRVQTRRVAELKGKLFYLGRLLRFFMRSFWTLSWKHIFSPYDVVHVHSVPDFEVFAAVIPRLLGAKVILDIHDLVPEFYCSKFGVSVKSFIFQMLVAIEREAIRFADHVIIANEIWRSRLISRSVSSYKCTTVMNYPDLRIFNRCSPRRSDDRFIVMYPGTISYHQGLDIAVRAFAFFTKQAAHAELHIYGDGPEKHALERLVDELSLKEKVRFFPLVTIEKVARYMAEADLGIVPKRRDLFGDEAFSTKSLEFMALGVPVLMANTTIDRFYFNESLVAFFKAGDDVDLARSLLRLYRNSTLRRKMSERCHAFIAENNWERKKYLYFGVLSRLVRLRENGEHHVLV